MADEPPFDTRERPCPHGEVWRVQCPACEREDADEPPSDCDHGRGDFRCALPASHNGPHLLAWTKPPPSNSDLVAAALDVCDQWEADSVDDGLLSEAIAALRQYAEACRGK